MSPQHLYLSEDKAIDAIDVKLLPIDLIHHGGNAESYIGSLDLQQQVDQKYKLDQQKTILRISFHWDLRKIFYTCVLCAMSLVRLLHFQETSDYAVKPEVQVISSMMEFLQLRKKKSILHVDNKLYISNILSGEVVRKAISSPISIIFEYVADIDILNNCSLCM